MDNIRKVRKGYGKSIINNEINIDTTLSNVESTIKSPFKSIIDEKKIQTLLDKENKNDGNIKNQTKNIYMELFNLNNIKKTYFSSNVLKLINPTTKECLYLTKEESLAINLYLPQYELVNIREICYRLPSIYDKYKNSQQKCIIDDPNANKEMGKKDNDIIENKQGGINDNKQDNNTEKDLILLNGFDIDHETIDFSLQKLPVAVCSISKYSNQDSIKQTRIKCAVDSNTVILPVGMSQFGARYKFSTLFNPSITDNEIYDKIISENIKKVIDGSHINIFFCGGDKKDVRMGHVNGEVIGFDKRKCMFITHAVSDIFEALSKKSPERYNIKISIIEIHNEKAYDLLSDIKQIHMRKPLEIRTRRSIGIQHNVEFINLTLQNLNKPLDVTKFLNKGLKAWNRKIMTDSKYVNSVSQIVITIHTCVSDIKDPTRIQHTKLNFIEMFSEYRTKKSNASYFTSAFTRSVEKLVSPLNILFKSVQENNKLLHNDAFDHSKLALLLKDAFTNDAEYLLIINISDNADYDTLRCIKFVELLYNKDTDNNRCKISQNKHSLFNVSHKNNISHIDSLHTTQAYMKATLNTNQRDKHTFIATYRRNYKNTESTKLPTKSA